MLKNKPFWFSIALTAAYLLAAYLAVPHWLQPKLEQYVKLQLGRQLQFEKLQFDPLTWSVELTGVHLALPQQGVGPAGSTGKQGLVLPDITLAAESVHLRFNYWRLRAAVSLLIVKSPLVTIDGASTLMQSGHYPFIGQWQAWRSERSKDAEHQSAPVRQWRLETGRMILSHPGTQTPDTVLLDDLLMHAQKANDAGQRAFTLAFTGAKGSVVRMQGEMDERELVSEGQYQWTASLPRNAYAHFPQLIAQNATPVPADVDFNADGQFSLSVQDDGLLIGLAQSQLSSDQLERCGLNGLLCAKLQPLSLSFSATLQAATQGVRLVKAQVQQAAFQLDASLAQGAVTLVQQQALESASIRVNALVESPDGAARDPLAGETLEFDLALQSANKRLLNANGRFNPKSEHAQIQFTSPGEPEFEGDLQWQWIATQQAEAAYPQLELRLDNPEASLARSFIAEHLSGQVVAEALQLLLTAQLNDGQLSFNERIRLQRVSVPGSADLSPALKDDAAELPGLNVPWLLALLQDPQSNVELVIPPQEIPLSQPLSAQAVVQAIVLEFLSRISAQPFEGLALQMGQQGRNLAAVQFESGSAELNASSSESLKVLADALLQRPGLGIALAGVYDPLIDNKALQTEQVSTHIGLATAADLAFQSGSKRPDFTDPLVHSVIDEFARRRLPAEVLEAFVTHFGEADVDRGVLPEGDIAAYYSALFELLVDHAEVPQGALVTLARYRAQAVTELLARQGVSPDRLRTAEEPHSSAAELTGVPLQLELVIHSGEDPGSLESSSPAGTDQENQGKFD